ncbi:MAG TPA: cyclic nucleotide-binding domain-containing protein, partial [Desulfatiglandales bacterium]|nr:cyclic nucleotide-binding domain-containing protein [Desulfatiglandales bacterium]
MTTPSIQEKAVEAIIILNAALTNLRLYPPTSAMIGNSVNSAYSILQTVIEQEGSMVFAESERNLIISGQALDEKDQKKPQVTAFIQLMLKQGIKSISFEKGLEMSDILGFLDVVSKKPEDLRKEGGVQKALSAKGTKNILLDQKLYVAMDKDQRIIAAKDIKDTGPEGIEERRLGEDRRKNDGLDYLAKGGIERRNQEQRGKHLLEIKNGINSILKGEDKAFADKQVMQALTPTVLDLISHGKVKVAEAIINRLGKGLLNEKEEIRSELAAALARMGIRFIQDKRMDEMVKTSRSLTEWIKFETQMPPAYRHICDQLKSSSQYLILNHRFIEARKVLEPFYLIHSGKIEKNEHIHALSGTVLNAIASEKILEILLHEIQAGGKGPGAKTVVDILIMLGSSSAGAKEALDKAKKGRAKEVKAGRPEKKEAGPGKTTEKMAPADDEFSNQMKLVDQYLEKNDAGAATKLMFDMIVKYSKEKDFEKADTLRDRIMEVNPMALTEIVKAGEIIDEAKSASIDQAHLETWAALYKTLTQEETTTLFFAMKSAVFDAKHYIFRQGERDTRLYFIGKGQLHSVFNQGDEEILIKELNPGDVMGEETFFNLTLCTSSAVTVSEVELYFLEQDMLAKWEKRSLGIESKLRDYCLKLPKTGKLLKEKGLDRRSHKRIEVMSKAS